MYAEVFPANDISSYIVSRLFYESHIYRALDDRMRDVWGAHTVLREIEDGKRLAIGVYRKSDDALMGFSHGLIIPDTMEAHILLKRKTDGLAAINLCMDKCREFYKKNNIPLKRFIAKVADDNRPAKLLLRRAGYSDKGIMENNFFVSFGKNIPCRFFEKEI
jgi:ribosomal protein S18 acetylase RimI-like enzyme